jgi:hypothetical protein
LAAIAGILESGRHYLLNERCFVLHPELIFVGARRTDVRLIYLPFQDMPAAPPANEQMLRLLETWREHAEQLPVKAWREIRERLSAERFQAGEFRRWCEERWREASPAEPGEERHEREQPAGRPAAGEPALASEAAPPADGRVSAPPDGRPSDPAVGRRFGLRGEPPAANRGEEPPDYVQELIPLEEAASTFLAATPSRRMESLLEQVQQPAVLTAVGLGLAVVLSLCLFFPFPGSNFVMIGSLVVFLAFVAGMLLWDRRKQHDMQELPETPDWAEAYPMFPGAQAAAPAAEPSPSAVVRTDPEGRTELLLPPERTVLLAGPAEGEPASSLQTGATLIVSRNGRPVKEIIVAEARYTIGRDAAACDYASEQTGVSRLHCELIRQGNEPGCRYALKDLGSRNGTRLNDTVVVPFKLYPLQHGDRIGILGETFEYRER